MTTSDDEFERLLHAARRAEAPSQEDRNAVRRALATAIAASMMTPAVAGAAKAGMVVGKGSTLANVLVSLVAGATLGAGVTATAFVVSGKGESDGGRNPAATVAPASLASAGAPPAAPPPVAAVPMETEQSKAEPTAPSPAPSMPKGDPGPPAVDPLELESRGIAEVQRALRDGHAARALALLDAEDRAHPRGVLVEERAAARVFTLCSLGKSAEAQRAASEFERRFPRSLLGERVRSSCVRR